MQQLLLDLATRYGYVVVLVAVGVESMGVPVPGETALLVGAVLGARGHLFPLWVGVAGWVGAVLGDNAGYLVGRRWGERFLSARLVRPVYTPERIALADRFFSRYGWLAVFLGRFVALLRIFAGPLAGMHRMPWPQFVLANGLGAIMWVGAVVLLGVLIGDNLDLAGSILTRSGYAGLGVVILVIALLARRHMRPKSADAGGSDYRRRGFLGRFRP
ncbi:MAG: DedA family protein [Candidatus Dormibacteria bacterium]